MVYFQLFRYFSDPFDEALDFDEEFSLENIPKLAKNYNKKNLNLQFPEISIFILWISKVAKSKILKDIYKILLLLLKSFTECY